MGVEPWLARTQEDFGRFLVEGGDRARGAELLDRAKATYTRLGVVV
jgi:hypothetical protein